MDARRWLGGIIFLLACIGLPGDEIVRNSLLDRAPESLSVKRDIFMPGPQQPAELRRGGAKLISEIAKSVKPKTERMKPEEKGIRRVMVFEGFIQRNNRLTGIISVNGEYFVVEAGEWVMDGVQVKELNEKNVTVSVEGKRVVVLFQGVEENEK